MTASTETAEDIYRQRGAAWAAVNQLPGWLPGRTSTVEFMHAVYLGVSFMLLETQYLLYSVSNG